MARSRPDERIARLHKTCHHDPIPVHTTFQPPLPPWPRGSAAVTPEEAFDGTWRRSGACLRPDAKASVWASLAGPEGEGAAAGASADGGAGSSSQRRLALERAVDALAFVGACLAAGQAVDDLKAVEWAIWFSGAARGDARCTVVRVCMEREREEGQITEACEDSERDKVCRGLL